MLLPDKVESYLTVPQALLLEEAFEELKELFHASGVGLPLTYLSKGTGAFIRAIIGFFEVTSDNLIALYESLEKNTGKTDRKDVTVARNHIIHLLAGRKDKEAQKFVKNVKVEIKSVK